MKVVAAAFLAALMILGAAAEKAAPSPVCRGLDYAEACPPTALLGS